ncbi:MAG: tetratricopeptide repeat protein [Deltaproteobacteria bacterium]|nr:tetratricopeptide repeat protein [Deltaproteobacteria bacterium]
MIVSLILAVVCRCREYSEFAKPGKSGAASHRQVTAAIARLFEKISTSTQPIGQTPARIAAIGATSYQCPMANRFCSSCGAKLVSQANFCVECGEGQGGAKPPRVGVGLLIERFAPLFVVTAIVLVGGGVILYGSANPKTPAVVPPRNSANPANAGQAGLPENHPPISIPDEVKQTIRDMVQKAQAAPDDLEAWKRVAEVQYRAGQLDPSYLAEASAAYRHIVEKDPNNLDALRGLGNVAYDQQQPDIAGEYYKQYLEKKPDDLEVRTDLGTMYLQAGQGQKAVEEYDRVLKTNPSFFQAQFNLAIAYRSLNQNDKSIESLEKARSLAPDDATRAQVEGLLARSKGLPVPTTAGHPPMPPQAQVAGGSAPGAAAPPAAESAPADNFKAAAEALFRQNPIMGPKVQRLEWSGDDKAKVYLRDFPMDQMGEQMRDMFADRMKGRIKEKKTAFNVSATTHFDLVDEASGRVMTSIEE